MNTKLVESLAQIIQSLTPEEKALLEAKLKAEREENGSILEPTRDERERPFYETATPEEWIEAFREWAESHPHNSPCLSDEAISRESIYGERG